MLDVYEKYIEEEKKIKEAGYRFYALNWRTPTVKELRKMGVKVPCSFGIKDYFDVIGFKRWNIANSSFDIVDIKTYDVIFSGTLEECAYELDVKMACASVHSRHNTPVNKRYLIKKREVIWP